MVNEDRNVELTISVMYGSVLKISRLYLLALLFPILHFLGIHPRRVYHELTKCPAPSRFDS